MTSDFAPLCLDIGRVRSVGSRNILAAIPLPGQQVVLTRCTEETVTFRITATEPRLNISPVSFSYAQGSPGLPDARAGNVGELERQRSWWLQLKCLIFADVRIAWPCGHIKRTVELRSPALLFHSLHVGATSRFIGKLDRTEWWIGYKKCVKGKSWE